MAITPSSLESKKPERLREPARMSFASARGKIWSRTKLMIMPNVPVSDTFLAAARSSVTYIIGEVAAFFGGVLILFVLYLLINVGGWYRDVRLPDQAVQRVARDGTTALRYSGSSQALQSVAKPI